MNLFYCVFWVASQLIRPITCSQPHTQVRTFKMSRRNKRDIQHDLDEKNQLIEDLNKQLDQQKQDIERLTQHLERMDRDQDVRHQQQVAQQQNQQQAAQDPNLNQLQHVLPVQNQQQQVLSPLNFPVLPHQIQPVLPEQQQQPLVNYLGRPVRLCRTYSGKELAVTPVSWINFFEIRTRTFTDQQRCDTLADYLDDEAQDWYMRQRTANNNITWQDLKQNFITFFSASVHSPGVTAAHTKFKPGDDLKKYFQEKCRYFDLANLRLVDRNEFLTDGIVEDSVREGMLIAKIKTLDEWYQKDGMLVSNYERKRESRNRFVHRQHPNPTPSSSSNIKPSFKPTTSTSQPPSCKICKSRNIVARHWHSDCPHRDTSSTSTAAPKCRRVAANEELEETEKADATPLNE